MLSVNFIYANNSCQDHCAHALADLNIHCPHMLEETFTRDMAYMRTEDLQMKGFKSTKKIGYLHFN